MFFEVEDVDQINSFQSEPAELQMKGKNFGLYRSKIEHTDFEKGSKK